MIKSKKLSSIKIIKHGFFNSIGGKSKGIYSSLNCGIGSSDKTNNVKKNLEIVRKMISRKASNIFLLRQLHSNKLIYIDKNYIFKKIKPEADAIITDQVKLPIAVLTADCVPILLCDKKKKLIGIIHAGWRGAYKKIIDKVIKFMIKKGCKSNDIIAVIGPSISIKNYEVKKDFIKKLIKNDGKNKKFFKKIKNKDFFNLKKYVHSQLKALNIKKIDIINKDTFNPKNNFFSARRSISRNENDYGRNISVIMIN